MFLDEARIIAGLRHPNLVAVHELGQEADELFMAMEYLEGDSVSGLCRLLAATGEHYDPYVDAHIVAEACAGLHAAHEATAAVGRPLGIVHRDVSPQYLFVTYDGHVYVIDFGIATTADRVSRTGGRHGSAASAKYLAPRAGSCTASPSTDAPTCSGSASSSSSSRRAAVSTSDPATPRRSWRS